MQSEAPDFRESVALLGELNDGYIRSIRSSDVDWFDEHLAEDFINTNPDGARLDRAGFLAQVARPPAVEKLEAYDVCIRLFGDTAVIHARTSYLTPDGAAGTGWYTDIWLRRDGRWLCVAAHVDRG